MMVRWSGENQVTVRLGSNLKTIMCLTLVDVKLVFHTYNLYFCVSGLDIYLFDWCQHYRLVESLPSINCRHKKVELIYQMIRDAPQHTILASEWSQPVMLASDWLIRPWLPALAQEWQQSTKRKGVAASPGLGCYPGCLLIITG